VRDILRRRLALGALGLTGALLLAACSRPVTAPPASNQPSNQPPTPPTQTTTPTAPQTLWEKHAGLQVIDVHNHDASAGRWRSSLRLWDQYKVAQVTLTGDVSEPSAVGTDQAAWEAYKEQPGRFFPIFSGFDLHDPSCLDVVKRNLEQGFFGLGEVIAASTRSPITSKVKWKGLHAMDGYLPAIYDLIAPYKAPIMLHMDPASQANVDKLTEALTKHPKTIFIWGHANIGITPAEMDQLLRDHPNLYVDFFAGFAVANPNLGGKLTEYVPVIEKHSDRVLVSSDSGYGVGYAEAYTALYQLLDQLSPAAAKKVAHANYTKLIEQQPATETQLAKIKELAAKAGKSVDLQALNKRKANELIFSLSK
jgi:predicted TIM-barrel fold metal-dependent hydrolase